MSMSHTVSDENDQYMNYIIKVCIDTSFMLKSGDYLMGGFLNVKIEKILVLPSMDVLCLYSNVPVHDTI